MYLHSSLHAYMAVHKEHNFDLSFSANASGHFPTAYIPKLCKRSMSYPPEPQIQPVVAHHPYRHYRTVRTINFLVIQCSNPQLFLGPNIRLGTRPNASFEVSR